MREDRMAPLRDFVVGFGRLLDDAPGEGRILRDGGTLLRRLVRCDGWLPEAFAQPDPLHYQQYLLHADSTERFSVVSFVWGPGQATSDDRVSISIHVYGANIGAVRRHTYPPGGGRKPFVSGYANSLLPNLWNRSAEHRSQV